VRVAAFLAICATSKGSIVLLSKGIALDGAKQKIRGNAIAPG
jgi:NAD(P)-dependent dehydrogenase (short-subunit alcohol dehydrogenase family)